MEKNKWSEYDKYLVLADNSHGKHKIRDTYESFLNYKIVMDVINRIAFTDKVHILIITIFIVRK